MGLHEYRLNEILSDYQNLQKKLINILDNSPTGYLFCQKHKGNDQFLHIYTQNKKRIRKGITKNKPMLRALGHKAFAEAALAAVETNIGLIGQTLAGLQPLEPEHLMQMLSRPYQLLPEDYLFDREMLVMTAHLSKEERLRIERHKGWGSLPYRQSQAYAQDRTIRTSAGVYVRSKNEALIVERLLRYGIEFHYDQEFEMCGETVVPDFTFEGGDGRLFLWEYMGMMDNPDYVWKNLRKLKTYCLSGFVPGGRLIVTFNYGGGIDMEMIDQVIRSDIIPRL